MGAPMAAYITISKSLRERGGLQRGNSAGIKLYGYYTFLVGVLARLLAETNCARFFILRYNRL